MSIILSVLVFSVLVLIHEFGHFLLAKKNGIGVTEFSLGMGPRIASFTKGGTKYSWKAIPFGGSCMMVGEFEDEGAENAFGNKSVWARISVVAAGPIFNFILALLLSIVIIGLQGYDKCTVSSVTENSGAEEAGLQEGDLITEYDGEDIVISRDLWLYQFMYETTNKPINITYKRDGKTYKIKMQPSIKYGIGVSYTANDDECQIVLASQKSPAAKAGMKDNDVIIALDGNKISSGKEFYDYTKEHPLTKDDVNVSVKRGDETIDIKITPTDIYYTGFDYSTNRVKTNALGTLRYSFTELRYNMESTIKSIVMLFTGKLTKNDVAGPVGIVSIVGDTYKESKTSGAYYVFLNISYLIVLFSVNLGVLNLLPLPALDGGRLVFLFIEAIRKKPVPREKEAIVHFVGMVLLMILMVLILFNDISKLL